MNKKILFVIPSMEIGGTRSSLLNLLNILSRISDSEFYLFIIKHEGDLYSQIPQSVKVLPEIKLLSWATPTRRKHSFLREAYHSIIAMLNKLFGYQRIYRTILNISGIKKHLSTFDISIGYQEGIATFVSSEVISRQYFCWIHSDIDKWYDEKNLEVEAYDKAQNIFFVADNTRKLFVSKFPRWEEKCEVIKNLLNKESIVQKSQESIKEYYFDQNQFNIVSVGRFTEAKAFDRVVAVAKYLKSKKHSFRWFLIGSGELQDKIDKLVHAEKLTDYVILLGSKDNPYPYIKMANLVVVSSINESQPMVILEALTLSKPVVSTGYPSAMEILKDGKYGYICDNDVHSLCVAVDRVITDKELYERLVSGAKDYDYNNVAILEKMRSLISF